MPGLPALLALCQVVFGDPALGIAVVQAIIYAALVLLAARAAVRIYGASSAPWVAAFVGLNPALGYYAAQALTEFLTGTFLFGAAVLISAWFRGQRQRALVLAAVLVAATGYLRSEYLAFGIVFALVVFILARRAHALAGAVRLAAVFVAVVVACMLPWAARYAIVTGRPALYNESPVSNLVLMGTWFRMFDEQTFARLQGIITSDAPNQQAIQQAGQVGPRPDISQRYVSQVRGPYELPLSTTLALAAGNVASNPRLEIINHFVLAPVLIWIGHTPLRQADAPRMSSLLRWCLWGAQGILLVLALGWALRCLRDSRARAFSLAFLGVVAFLTAVHILLAVDDRFTIPALPLAQAFAGAACARFVPRVFHLRQPAPAL